MRRLHTAFIALFAVTAALLFASWDDQPRQGLGPIPQPPVYSDSSQWFIRDRGSDVDLFYIISTETGDHLVGSDTCHFADTYDDYLRGRMAHEMHAVDSFYSGRLNYFSPFYRQASMQSWTSEELALSRLPVPLSDTRRAWAYYLEHFNQGRPFILAGFSQGAHVMMDLIKAMPDSVASRMVAAYFIGYKVRQEDTAVCRHLRPATGPDDTGVSICFNSVKSPECALGVASGGNLFCINPVNWRTDTVSTPFVLYGRKRNDTLTVRCAPEHHLLIVSGYQERFLTPVIGRPGNYHSMELKFYYPYIRENMARRVEAFLARKRSANCK